MFNAVDAELARSEEEGLTPPLLRGGRGEPTGGTQQRLAKVEARIVRL
jgi:hypothetical protein